jgi:hypothetical protein
MICSDLLKYYHYISCFLDDWPSTNAAKGKGNETAEEADLFTEGHVS